MEVPPSLLTILKCSSCESLLSRGPVYLQNDGVTICGRCFSPSSPANRNTIYEATAKLLLFPCKYQDLGCNETVPFVDQTEEIPHEQICEYRQYVCPIVGSANCEWLGRRQDILKHCRSVHSDQIIHSPTTLTHDISKSSLKTFLLLAYEVLFLLHAKVCLVSGKIFHSIRYLGENSEAEKFIYILDIKRGSECLSKIGQVAPQGCLTIQEPTSLAVNTNSLLDVLGGYDGTNFTVTVKMKDEKKDSSFLEDLTKKDTIEKNDTKAKDRFCKKEIETSTTKNLGICAKSGCESDVTQYLTRNYSGWFCTKCAPPRRFCTNKELGCNYENTKSLCTNHETYCNYSTYCTICRATVSKNTLFSHFSDIHVKKTYEIGSTWRLTKTKTESNCIISNKKIITVCKYTLTKSRFIFKIFLQSSTIPLYDYLCIVYLTDSDNTENKKRLVSRGPCNNDYDWSVEIHAKSLASFSGELDICIKFEPSRK